MDLKEKTRKRTRKACTACRKAKTSCSDQRPCTRCVRLKKEDQCFDIPATSSMSERDRETWVRVANYLRDPRSMPPHVAEALEQQVSLVIAEPGASPQSRGSPSFVLQKYSKAKAHDDNVAEELQRLQEANSDLRARLQAALAKMEREQTVQHSFYFFGLTTGADTIAMSHWSFPSTQLIHFNSQFRDLSQRSETELSRPGFTCKRLFMEAFVQRCVKILMFLSHGTVSSMTVPQIWKDSKGRAVNVTSMVYIEVDRESGHVAKIIMASTPAGANSKDHKFDTAFLPDNVSFRSNAPINQRLLDECRGGILEQIQEARATPVAWGSDHGSSVPSPSPEFLSPQQYTSSSPMSRSVVDPLDFTFVDTQETPFGAPLHPPPAPLIGLSSNATASSSLASFPPVKPATSDCVPQSRVSELLQAELEQHPSWRDSEVPEVSYSGY